jgi:hypothetical protein
MKSGLQGTAVAQFVINEKPEPNWLQCICEENVVIRGVQALSHHNTAIHQLLKPLSRHEFESLAREHHQGQKLRRASRWDQFLGMTLSQLSGRQNLRDIESNLQAQRNKLYHLAASRLPEQLWRA